MRAAAVDAARAVRAAARSGRLKGNTAGLAPMSLQANMVSLPRAVAIDFAAFCSRNPRSCPVVDVLLEGETAPVVACLPESQVDVRTDLPAYRRYERGELTGEAHDATAWWRNDLVTFLVGCSFTFERALLDAGVPVRHVEDGCNVPMFQSSIECRPAGPFRGHTVVSMRPMTPADAVRASAITARYPGAHGAPVHVGDPEAIGVRDLAKPEWGDAVTVRPGEVPVFWACGITPQAVALASRPELMITHAPGSMLVCDATTADFCV